MVSESKTDPPEDNGYERVRPQRHGGDDNPDRDKFPNMHGRNLMLGGAIVILGLILGGLILGYNVMNTETHRGDSAPANSSIPVRP
jgi:hypothetical protein